jgi:VWFA-related protein
VPVYVVQYDTRGQYRPAAPLERQGKGLRIEAAPPGAFDTLPYVAATTSLEALAETTGGRVFTAQSLASAGEAFDEVARELKGQYTIAYYPSNQARDGQERRITVTARRPDLALRYRGSYRAPRPNPARTPAGK